MIVCAIAQVSIAQNIDQKEEKPAFKNEISSNVLDLVVAGSLNIDYQYLMKDNQSLLFGLTAFDTYGYFDSGDLESSSAFTLRAAWVIYMSRYQKHGGFNFYPLIKIRTGEVETNSVVYREDASGNEVESNDMTYDISGLSAGFGVGYKWVVRDTFSIGTNFELTRLLGKDLDEENSDLGVVEPRVTLAFGYRF